MTKTKTQAKKLPHVKSVRAKTALACEKYAQGYATLCGAAFDTELGNLMCAECASAFAAEMVRQALRDRGGK